MSWKACAESPILWLRVIARYQTCSVMGGGSTKRPAVLSQRRARIKTKIPDTTQPSDGWRVLHSVIQVPEDSTRPHPTLESPGQDHPDGLGKLGEQTLWPPLCHCACVQDLATTMWASILDEGHFCRSTVLKIRNPEPCTIACKARAPHHKEACEGSKSIPHTSHVSNFRIHSPTREQSACVLAIVGLRCKALSRSSMHLHHLRTPPGTTAL